MTNVSIQTDALKLPDASAQTTSRSKTLESETIYRQLFNNLNDGICIAEVIYDETGNPADYKLIEINAAFTEQTGLSDAAGKNVKDLFPDLEADRTARYAAKNSSGNPVGLFAQVTVMDRVFNIYIIPLGSRETKKVGILFKALTKRAAELKTNENIADREAAEIALKKALALAERQKRLYDTVSNNTPDLVYVFDLNCRFTYANKALLEMWGLSWEQSIGKGLRENGYQEWHAQLHEREISEIIKTKKSIRGTVSFPHAELGSRIYDYIFAPVFDETGQVEAIAGTTRDITDLTVAVTAAEESEKNLRNTIMQAPVAICIFKGPDFIVETANDRMFELWNRQKEAVLGKSVFVGMPEVKDQGFEELLEKVYTTGETFSAQGIPVTLPRKNGVETVYINLLYEPFLDGDGNISGVVAAASDVTAQVIATRRVEESEANLRNMVVQAPVGMCVLDADTLVCEIVNESFVEIAGRPREAILQHGHWEAFPEMRATYKSAMQKVINTATPFYANEVELPLVRHGKEEMVYVTFVYMPNVTDGVVRKVVIWVLDNTDQVQARRKIEESENRFRTLSQSLEELVRERTKELQRSNNDLQQFAHVASHDLKEPVRKVKIFANRLEQQLLDQLDDASKLYIAKIHSAANRMYTMIDGVLAYSATNASVQKPQQVDLNEVIESIETDLEVVLAKTGAAIRYKDLPSLEGAPVLIYQLFYNLINNSIKFARAGVSPEITISAEDVIAEGESKLNIFLQDNGIGFEQAEASRIFDTFSRLNPKDQYEGTGLGLSLCRKIVERHGGNISASGIPGSGATFSITFPATQKQHSI